MVEHTTLETSLQFTRQHVFLNGVSYFTLWGQNLTKGLIIQWLISISNDHQISGKKFLEIFMWEKQCILELFQLDLVDHTKFKLNYLLAATKLTSTHLPGLIQDFEIHPVSSLALIKTVVKIVVAMIYLNLKSDHNSLL